MGPLFADIICATIHASRKPPELDRIVRCGSRLLVPQGEWGTHDPIENPQWLTRRLHCMTFPVSSIQISRQPRLPLFSQAGDLENDPIRAFAHPAEQEVGRLLTFFGLRWTYEPTTFALRRHPNGTIAEAFTPDFFLPDLALYLELTTMRQKLVTRKNHKARLLRQLYPNVDLRLIYRRDYLRMMECYRGEMRRTDSPDVFDIIRTEQEIERAVDNTALRLLARYHRGGYDPTQPLALLTVDKGSHRFQRELASRLVHSGLRIRELDLGLLREEGPLTQPRIRATNATLNLLRRTPLVLVETLVSTGLTLGHAQRWLAERSVDAFETVALFARPGCRIGNARVDHVAFEAPNDVIAGYGLQLRAAYADLSYVARLRAAPGSALTLVDCVIAAP
jgi:hypoxanthine-guanine phosphoribosyltransferase